MSISVQAAIDDLYRIAVTEGRTQSPVRLRMLADYCIQELGARGLRGASAEQDVPGAGRTKSWDVAWEHDAKIRLVISLKSLLKNLQGTVPNRVDDLMGEVANVQLLSPEIVCGYVMVIDTAEDQNSPKHGCTWTELLEGRLRSLSGRKAPHWATGTIESFVLARVDFSKSTHVQSPPTEFEGFFDCLVVQVRERNPGLQF